MRHPLPGTCQEYGDRPVPLEFQATNSEKGEPKKIYSDNPKTFAATAKWLKHVQQDEQFHHFLANENIM